MTVRKYPSHLAIFLAIALGAGALALLMAPVISDAWPKSRPVLPRMIQPPAGTVAPPSMRPVPFDPDALSRSNDGTIAMPDRPGRPQYVSHPL